MYSSIAILATLAAGTMAQTTSTSVSDFFLGGPTATSQSWAASVISAGADGTAYEIMCAGGVGCPSAARTISQTLTLAPTALNYAYSTELSGNEASISETCTISGTTAAVCTIVATVEIGSQSTEITTTTSYSGSGYVVQPVTITAGLEKLASVSASGTASGSAASSSGASASASGGSDTSGAQSTGRAGDVMALVMIPSVAAVIGALLLL